MDQPSRATIRAREHLYLECLLGRIPTACDAELLMAHCTVAGARCRLCWMGAAPPTQERSFHVPIHLCCGRGGHMQRTLPFVLGLTFLVVPSSSTRVFRSFVCEPIEYSSGDTRRYLAADLALSCDTDKYTTTRLTAFVFMAVWPVGIPFLYAVLLWSCRAALSAHVPTRLSRATAFLWSDYSTQAFWWEPLEMCRKLVLTGWLVVIFEEKAELARVVAALLFSIAFLVLRVSVKPPRRCAARLDATAEGGRR
eukprot:2422789-Prymnesium_polylepis.2